MPRAHIQKALFFIVSFIKQTTLKHKKKLATLVVIALLTYIAKRKLRIAHLLTIAQNLTRLLSYLPLPQFPTYRQINRYESPRLNTLATQIIEAMNVDALTLGIRQKTSTWDQLKTNIFAGTILSLTLYNVQSFYFVVQNKYEKDFLELQAIEVFDEMMGGIKKRFQLEISNSMQAVVEILSHMMKQINVRRQVSLDDLYNIIDQMMDTVFVKKLTVKKDPNQHLNKSIYKNQQSYNIAKNYFTTALNYIPIKKSSLSKITSKISSIKSLFSFSLFTQPHCEPSLQRFDLTKIYYQIPLKKSPTDQLSWPNRESELLSKLILTQMDQLLTSINFSTLLYYNAQYNCTVLKNRLFLYFSKKELQKLKIAEVLPVMYKLLKEQVLVPGTHGVLKEGEERKRERFYEGEILKAIRHKTMANQLQGSNNNAQHELLIKPQPNLQNHLQPDPQHSQHSYPNPQLILLNMHLEQIYQSRQLNHLVRQFQIKYFNERSGVTLNPMQRKSNEQDEMKKLLSMLGDNETLNRRQDQKEDRKM